MSLASLLPKPKNEIQPKKKETVDAPVKPRECMEEIPPYGSRAGFQLSGDDEGDFPNDSGAYPEIHTLQYPFGLGRKRLADDSTSLVARSTVARQYDAQGRLQYDLLARMGHDEGRVVQASLADMLPAPGEGESCVWGKPPAEEITRQTEATRAALERVLNGRIKATQPKHAKAVDTSGAGRAHLVRFTPADALAGGEAAPRVVRMTEAQRDPLDPPAWSHRRIPKPPPSPPAPVLHSPPRRVTAEEQAAWRVPPCISNWKNAKGYTIPLEKRLAADGRGLLEHGISGAFAGFAESLYLAEQHARAEVEKRAAVEQKIASAKRAQAEENLRLLAQQARAEKALIAQRLQAEMMESAQPRHDLPMAGSGLTLQEREAIRRETAKEVQRDLRLSRMGAEQRARHLARDAERDISERVALGVAAGASLAGNDSMYDQRLFDQTAGVSAGFGEEDDYSLYSKPLFGYGAAAAGAHHLIYRPNEEGFEGEDSGPGKGFQGASSTRTAPVEFERAPPGEDPFGLDQMLHEAKLGAKRSAPPPQ